MDRAPISRSHLFAGRFPYIKRLSPALRAGDIRATAAHTAPLARAFRSTKSSVPGDAPPACDARLSPWDNQRLAGTPLSHNSSDSPDRYAPPLATEDRHLLSNASLFRLWAHQLSGAPHFSRQKK